MESDGALGTSKASWGGGGGGGRARMHSVFEQGLQRMVWICSDLHVKRGVGFRTV